MTQHYLRDLSDFLRLYRDACEWFSSIGFEWAVSRYGIYEKHFSKFESLAESGDTSSSSIEMKHQFDNAYLEANEIIRVYSDLQQLEKTQFFDQLTKVLSGQEFRGQVDNDHARDFLFELSTAARFLRADCEVTLSGVCDVVAEIPEGTIFVECKRMKSANKIAKNIKKATEQLKRRIGKNPSKKVMGLVAANVTDLIQSPRYLAPDSPMAATILLRTLANTFLQNYSNELTPKSTSKRLLGSMVECSAIWYLSDRSPMPGLVYTRRTNFIQLAKPEILEVLAPRICNQDIVR